MGKSRAMFSGNDFPNDQRRRVAFLRVAFLRVAFLRVAFLRVVFFAAFLRVAFLRVAFLRVAFLRVVFFAAFLRVAFLRVAFLRVAFFAAFFLVAFFFAITWFSLGTRKARGQPIVSRCASAHFSETMMCVSGCFRALLESSPFCQLVWMNICINAQPRKSFHAVCPQIVKYANPMCKTFAHVRKKQAFATKNVLLLQARSIGCQGAKAGQMQHVMRRKGVGIVKHCTSHRTVRRHLSAHANGLCTHESAWYCARECHCEAHHNRICRWACTHPTVHEKKYKITARSREIAA